MLASSKIIENCENALLGLDAGAIMSGKILEAKDLINAFKGYKR